MGTLEGIGNCRSSRLSMEICHDLIQDIGEIAYLQPGLYGIERAGLRHNVVVQGIHKVDSNETNRAPAISIYY